MNKTLIIIFIFILSFSKSYANNLKFIGLNKLSMEDLNRITSTDLYKKSFNIYEIDQITQDLYNSDLIEEVTFKEFSDNYIISIKEYSIIENIYINEMFLSKMKLSILFY